MKILALFENVCGTLIVYLNDIMDADNIKLTYPASKGLSCLLNARLGMTKLWPNPLTQLLS